MRTIDVASLTLEPQTAAHAEQMFIQLSDPAIYEDETKPLQSLEWLRERLTTFRRKNHAPPPSEFQEHARRVYCKSVPGSARAGDRGALSLFCNTF